MPEPAEIDRHGNALYGRLRTTAPVARQEAKATARRPYAGDVVMNRAVPGSFSRMAVRSLDVKRPVKVAPSPFAFEQQQDLAFKAPAEPKIIEAKPQDSEPVRPVRTPIFVAKPKPVIVTSEAPSAIPIAQNDEITPVEMPSVVQDQPEQPLSHDSYRSGLVSFIKLNSRMARRLYSTVLHSLGKRAAAKLQGYSRPQIALGVMAVIVFVVGITVSIQTVKTNRLAAAQVAALSKQLADKPKEPKETSSTGSSAMGTTTNADAIPSTAKPTTTAVTQYTVPADNPRFIKIPKLGVNARVRQTTIGKNNELGTPSNVYDTAWYAASAKPGQPGATLIDGHVSSWTTNGVFYGIKTLVAGDTIQIEKGDHSVVTYRVVSSQTYDADHVDMRAAVSPITVGKSGLNLITCTGSVKPGTSEFDKRVIVFAEQV